MTAPRADRKRKSWLPASLMPAADQLGKVLDHHQPTGRAAPHHDERLHVGRGIVAGVRARGHELGDAEQRLARGDPKRRRRLDHGGHQLRTPFPRAAVEQLPALRSPNRLVTARQGYLDQIALLRERPDVDLGPSRLVGDEREPPAVR